MKFQLVLAVLLVASAITASAQNRLERVVIASGTSTLSSANGTLTARITVGQAVAHSKTLKAGELQATTGYWVPENNTDMVFRNSFE